MKPNIELIPHGLQLELFYQSEHSINHKEQNLRKIFKTEYKHLYVCAVEGKPVFLLFEVIDFEVDQITGMNKREFQIVYDFNK